MQRTLCVGVLESKIDSVRQRSLCFVKPLHLVESTDLTRYGRNDHCWIVPRIKDRAGQSRLRCYSRQRGQRLLDQITMQTAAAVDLS